MNFDQLFRSWIEPFDVFISYARRDNAEPEKMVSAVVEELEADFARFAEGLKLNIFFDKKSILDGQYWQSQIYKGLRQSKSMLAFLSPAYFESEWCLKEWDEYIRLEQSRTFPGEALTPIFVIAPQDIEQKLNPAGKLRYEAAVQRNGVVELIPFWPKGRQALQEIIVKDRLHRIAETIQARVKFGRELAKVPRDTFDRNPRFTGRDQQLAQLRDELSRHHMAGVCAVHGIGGIGKSSVAREYAHRFRPEYLGGQFEISLANKTRVEDLLSEIVRRARMCGVDIPYALPEAEQYQRANDYFNRLDESKKVLFILDNLDEGATAILKPVNRLRLPSAEKVHYLVTTRAEARQLGDIRSVSLDVLDPAEALDMLFAYKTFAYRDDDAEYLAARQGTMPHAYDDTPADAEWKAALAIVNKLGRHSLSVALVGAYLGTHDIPYREFLRQMEQHGIGLALDAVGNDDAVQALIAHPVTVVGQLFAQSLQRLTPLALRTLEYAAFLPADLVSLAWLKTIIEADDEMKPHLVAKPFAPPAWEETLRTLAGLDYLKGSPFARMHRVVQEVVKQRMSEDDRERRFETVVKYVYDLTARNQEDTSLYTSMEEVQSVVLFVGQCQNFVNRWIGLAGAWLSGTILRVGDLRQAKNLAQVSERILRGMLAKNNDDPNAQRDLSISFERVGTLCIEEGKLSEARQYFEQCLVIALRLVEAEPRSPQKQRDLAVSFSKLGQVCIEEGKLSEARQYFEQCLVIARQIDEADPSSVERQRDLSMSFNELGEVCVKEGNLSDAREYFEQGLVIARQLAETDPHSAQKQRELSILFEKLGEVCVAEGKLSDAREYFERALVIAHRLAEAEPRSAQKQRDLSLFLNELGNVCGAEGNLSDAREYFEQGLVIRRQLAEADPRSAEKQRDLSISFNELGKVCVVKGNLSDAREYFEQGLVIARQLAETDPHSAQKQRDLWVSHWKLADLAEKENDPNARNLWQKCLDVFEGMIERGMHISPSDLRSLQRLRKKLA